MASSAPRERFETRELRRAVWTVLLCEPERKSPLPFRRSVSASCPVVRWRLLRCWRWPWVRRRELLLLSELVAASLLLLVSEPPSESLLLLSESLLLLSRTCRCLREVECRRGSLDSSAMAWSAAREGFGTRELRLRVGCCCCRTRALVCDRVVGPVMGQLSEVIMA